MRPGNESTYICEICSCIDNEPIVRCDKCHLWFHFTCVNAPKDVEKHDWFCSKCKLEEPVVDIRQVPESNVEQNGQAKVEKETMKSTGSNPAENRRVSTPPTVDKAVDDQQVIKAAIVNRSRKSRSCTSSASRRRSLALLKLEEERRLELEEQERRERNNKEYLQKKYSILEQEMSESEDLSLDEDEIDPFKLELINRWTERVHPMSSTGANYDMGHQEARDKNGQVSNSTAVNTDANDIDMLFEGDLSKQGNSELPATSEQSNNIVNYASRPQNVPVVSTNQRPQQNTLTRDANFQEIASFLSQSIAISSQEFDSNAQVVSTSNQVFTSCDTNQANLGRGITTHQVHRAQTFNAQGQHQQNLATNQNFVPRSQFVSRSLATNQALGSQSQSQQIYKTQTSVAQQNLTTSQSFGSQNQAFVSLSQPCQPPMSYNQPFMSNNRTFTANNQQFVSTNQPIISSQKTNFNQPIIPIIQPTITSQSANFTQHPFTSTFVYQTNMGNHQPISSNYQHQPIVSHHQQPISSNYQHQPIVSHHQQPISSNYQHQPIVYHYGQPIVSNYQGQNQPDMNDQPGNLGLNGGTPNNSNYTTGMAGDDNNNHEQIGRITMQNIMSRQVIDKKLPIFAGNPEEWDAWYNRYTSTTAKCNLDNSENLDRLEKCLKGKARDMVKSKFGQTQAVPWIISTLQKVFGKPETVLKSTMKRIRDNPPIKSGDLKSMMEFAFEVQSVSTAIESSGLLNQYRNPMLLEELVDKLPGQTKLEWARYKRRIPNVTIKTFTEWLDELADDISTVVEPTVEKYNKKADKKIDRETAHINVHVDGTNRNKESASTIECSKDSHKSSICITCGKGCQKVENCSSFNSSAIEQKWKLIKKHKLCRLCLRKHKFPCKSKNVCGKNGCTYKHHELLHNEEKYPPKDNKGAGENTTSAGNNVHYEASDQVMLKYAPVILHKNNKKIKTIAFFDDGSQTSMMEQKLADELGLKGTTEQLCLLWTDNIHRTEEAQRVSLEISGEYDSDHRYPLNGIRAVSSLQLPAQTYKSEELMKQYPYLMNVPASNYENAFPGILIGSDFPKLGSQLKVIEGEEFNGPVASETRLGWVVHGPRGRPTNKYHVNSHQIVQLCPNHNQLDHEIHQRVKEFFSIENFGIRANPKMELESKENQRALNLLNKLTKKVDGSYETGLLWKHDEAKKNLPDSYPMAMKRLISLEKQGEKIVTSIGDKIDEYVAKGYARKLSEGEVKRLGDNVWYLPVFGVVHPKKPDKLRMVFDAAAKVKSVSLNSMLLTGPDELASMVDILRRLREKVIAIGGDIKEMFHQVKIQKADQRYQLFLFRHGDSNRKPDVYVMSVMTFGAKCSPAAAQFIKNTNAKKFTKTHPRAVEAIIDNHYVDDMMDGGNTIEETIQMTKDVKMIHANGGFEIRNFISNSPEVLKAMGVTNVCNGKEISLDHELKTERVLGMWWNTKLDVFTFSLKYTLITKEILDGMKMPTKRELLRTLMSIFDPLGLLSNYLIQLKIILQDVWRMDLNWDEQISYKGQIDKWKQWLQFLPGVESVQVPRLYSLKLTSEKPRSIEIHTFVDASIDAFSAVTYIRIEDKAGVDCALIGSKARVAPLKYLSIPRKELQAAVLGTRLTTSIIEAQRFKVDRRILWSDSETVLSWLKSDHKKYSQYVAHRVGEILDSSDVNEWRWVPTKENVADEATKWSKSMNFESSNRWFSGPQYLRLNEDKWPKKKTIKPDVEEEMKAHYAHASLTIPQLVNAERFSKWNRMVRAVAYSIRFRNVFTDQNCKGKPLSQEEIIRAENLIFRQAQFEGYPSEMVLLERNKSLPISKQKFIEKPSSLYDGSPYLDADGILRMRGRIDGARDLSLDTKRPVILPKDSRITILLVHHYHVKYFHQNHGTVINEIRQRFYIPRLRVVLKKVRNNCQMCKVKLAKTMEPEMADLPPARLATFFKPFSYTGVDYFGPMKVKIGKRNEKRWGVLFTCLTVRAVHIELVSSLDTDSCIKCIGNFIADRGEVIEFHSDCGTNFVEANNELKKELEKLDPEKLKTEFTSRYTNWIFNPPAAAHMGGSWERLIRSVKSGVNYTLPERTPKEETLRNALKEIQNVVNSRPLTFIPLEVEEDEALTPNHFLHGSSSGMKPPCELNVDGEYLRKSWKESQRLTELFWSRFVKEYLPTITRRTKWFKPTKPLSPNDLVLVVDEKNPRNTYPKAKVLETKIGSNGQVRRAKIQLIAEAKTGRDGKICQIRRTELWTPAHKLAILDVLSKPEVSLADSSDRKTGGRMLETNVNTGVRRSPRNIERSGNTRIY